MDVLVIGAGIVGLAVARSLALRGHAVIVAEATGGIGNGVSSRNSEVIHGGMYYPGGSLRARHCVAGRRMLYAFCESHGVPHRRCGKLIVATNDLEQAKIEGIHEQGIANGVEELRFLSGAEARALEPHLACTGAVLSPETGIIDSHAFMLALQGDLESAGGAIAFHTPVEAPRPRRERAGTSAWAGAIRGRSRSTRWSTPRGSGRRRCRAPRRAIRRSGCRGSSSRRATTSAASARPASRG